MLWLLMHWLLMHWLLLSRSQMCIKSGYLEGDEHIVIKIAAGCAAAAQQQLMVVQCAEQPQERPAHQHWAQHGFLAAHGQARSSAVR